MIQVNIGVCLAALLYKALQNELLQFWPHVSQTRGLKVPRPYQVMPKYRQKSYSMTKTNVENISKNICRELVFFVIQSFAEESAVGV